jgi:hypothetical protein
MTVDPEPDSHQGAEGVRYIVRRVPSCVARQSKVPKSTEREAPFISEATRGLPLSEY